MNVAARMKPLISTPANIAMTLLALGLTVFVLPPLLEWTLFDATFRGDSAAACQGQGACWVFVRTHLDQFVYGFYPQAQRWRVDVAFLLFAVFIAALWSPRVRYKSQLAVGVALLYPAFAFWLFYGGGPLPVVETTAWGGLFLTLVLSIVGIIASFPLGVLLALGRRSELPVARGISTVFIELMRGVPLITVLFMASVMFPLFLPEGLNVDKLLRALIGIILFASAYMAEVVRGGLQAIPDGQYEAAKALGLGYWRRIGLIVLPQALRISIPAIVNTFLALFKDTTLVLIIGLFDLLGIVQAAATDPEWLGYVVEGYVFCALVYWLFCAAMSRYSQHLEQQLGVAR